MKFVVSCLSLLATFSMVSGSPTLYQVVVYATNPPDGALDNIGTNSLKVMFKFLQAEPNYASLGPGQSSTTSTRKLSEDSESNLRGNSHRELWSTCPSSCKSSGSAYCKSIGCAYCGASCGRRLSAALSTTDASTIQANMNQYLAQFCNNLKGCSITADILIVNPDGSTTSIFR